MPQSAGGNRILHGLNADEFAILQPHLQELTIARGAVLAEAGQTAVYLYFPVSAVIALVGVTESGASVEVALVGREGVASVLAALGRQRLHFRMVTQMEGTAWRVATDVVTRQIHQCRELHERLLLYSHELIGQVAQSAICNRFHTARQRLARWLLMTADRVESIELPLTHEFISNMVGGPRSAVTEAAAALRESGAIDYSRGHITIRSVAKLRQQACECYEAVQDADAKN
jgi:CRP-like cAMP-binding protein